jgi:dedicator of cytokinesis protein 3
MLIWLSARRTGSWLPLPYIHTGFIVHPFTPSGFASSIPPKSPNFRNRFSWSGIRKAGHQEGVGATGGRGNIYELALDVGDEFFAFEEYKCTIEEDGKGDTWYRG